jgi:hypothetical protein
MGVGTKTVRDVTERVFGDRDDLGRGCKHDVWLVLLPVGHFREQRSDVN